MNDEYYSPTLYIVSPPDGVNNECLLNTESGHSARDNKGDAQHAAKPRTLVQQFGLVIM